MAVPGAAQRFLAQILVPLLIVRWSSCTLTLVCLKKEIMHMVTNYKTNESEIKDGIKALVLSLLLPLASYNLDMATIFSLTFALPGVTRNPFPK